MTKRSPQPGRYSLGGRPRLTETGRGILMGTIFVLLACCAIPAFGILTALLALQLVALGLGWWFRPRIRVYGSWPAEALAGDCVTAQFTLENRSRYPAYQLVIAPRHWPGGVTPQTGTASVVTLDANQRQTVTLSVRCQQRGLYTLESPVCSSSFPFNLYRFGTRPGPSQSVLILPAFRPVKLAGVTAGHRGGRWSGRTRNLIGYSPEYSGSRPFLPGDSPRHMDARAWARLGRPAVKEYFEESGATVALVLDTWMGPSGRRDMGTFLEDFEAAVSMTAAIAYALPPNTAIACLVTGTVCHALPPNNLPLQVERVHRLLATVAARDEGQSSHDLDPLLESLSSLDEVFFVGVYGHERTDRLLDLARQRAGKVTCFRVGPTTEQTRPSVSRVDAVESRRWPSPPLRSMEGKP